MRVFERTPPVELAAVDAAYRFIVQARLERSQWQFRLVTLMWLVTIGCAILGLAQSTSHDVKSMVGKVMFLFVSTSVIAFTLRCAHLAGQQYHSDVVAHNMAKLFLRLGNAPAAVLFVLDTLRVSGAMSTPNFSHSVRIRLKNELGAQGKETIRTWGLETGQKILVEYCEAGWAPTY